MPGQYHLSVDEAVKVAQEAYDLGIRGVEIFGIPTYKDEQGSSAWDMEQPVQQAIKAIREAVPNLLVIADVCLCQYTSTGHCGMIDHHEILMMKHCLYCVRLRLAKHKQVPIWWRHLI